MTIFKELDSAITSTIRDIQRPAAMRPLNMHSPAMEVFIDFTQQQPLMLEQSATIDGAREMMKSTHIKLLLVIDSHESFQGVISLDDMVSERVMNVKAQSRVPWRKLTVEQVMTPRSRLRAIDFTEFQLANIADVVAAMTRFSERHLIVVDKQNRSLRGIVSAHSIARRMHEPFVISERNVAFSDSYWARAG
jgi:DeoR family transcriptional regulator, catabolite repression regulator